MKTLNEEEVKNSLSKLNGWNLENNSIHKTFVLKNFSSVLAFSVQIGIEAEKIDHHPNLFIHEWNKLTVTLSTHHLNGVTEKDIILAYQIEGLL